MNNDNNITITDESGKEIVFYEPDPALKQPQFHASKTPNVLALGTRGTGKSLQLRMDAHLRCLLVPNFRALIVRRTMPELRKALALDTPIPTPNGWTTMGSLHRGDTVFAPDGTPVSVLWKSESAVDENGTYRITFDNGESFVASAGHKWAVSTRMQRRLGNSRVLTTEQIAQKVHAEQDGRSNYAIPVASAWQSENEELPIDPYVLGAWLGDGTSGQGAITTADPELIEEIQQAGYLVVKRPAHRLEWSIRGLMTQLRSLGVLRDKRVPDIYLRGSYAQRLALLQGLMDTDGWCREDHLCGFAQTNERRSIALVVFQLAASLGLKPRWSERPAVLNGIPHGTSYEVHWTGDVPVFRLTRKLARLGCTLRSTQRWHYIVSCEQIEDTICQCIAVDHPSHQFLVGRASIPTHNSHLVDIGYEMKLLGGVFLSTTNVAKYPNGSTLTFGHCETEADIMNFLSSQYGFIGFDELSTFTLNQFLQISAACRAPTDAPYDAVVRAGSNPLGIGAGWMKKWFITKNVRIEDYPDYNPDDFEMIFSKIEDNRHLDVKQYTARLRNLPDHVRKAWLKGEFVNEGAYFSDFMPTSDDRQAWHCIDDIPTFKGKPLFHYSWLSIYRAIDWGYFPDPAVCLWIAVLPNKRAIVFKERTWRRTLAADVAQQIKQESDGMHIVETFSDPTMFAKTGAAVYSIGEIFEQNGVPLTPSQNSRELFGYSIHNYLNTVIDELPQVQIVKPVGMYGCPELIRTIPELTMDKSDPRKIAEGEDHWAVAFAYFCMGMVPPSNEPESSPIPRWMRPRQKRRSFSC